MIAYNHSDVPPVFETKNPASVMVFGAAASDGSVMDPRFIESGLKIGTKEYLDILKNSLLPWMEQKFGLDNVVLIQDSAPCHGSKATQAFLGEKVPFFVRAKIWPSSSPDLNLLDYFLWGVLQARTNASPHSSVNSLKTCIVRATRKIKKAEVAAAAKRFRSRVEAVIAQKGGHIE